MMTDPIGDMLTRIRNAGTARHVETRCPASKLRRAVATVLQSSERTVKREVSIRDVKLWSTTSPFLYVARATLTSEAMAVVDREDARFGMRSVQWRAVFLISVTGILIFLFFTMLSHLLLRKWHESAIKREL